MNPVSISLGVENIGSIDFRHPGQSLVARRTASGFRLLLPALITFSTPMAGKAPLLLESLSVTFSAQTDGKLVEIGTGYYPQVLRTSLREHPFTFSWDWLLPTFAFYERLRNGTEPVFQVTLSGDVRHVVGEPGREVCSIASRFHQPGEVRYSREAWTTMMKELNLGDVVLVEIPFSPDPPSGWVPVWDALKDARDSFEKGGTTGWKNCVASVRHALDEWRKIEAEDQGAGWQRPKQVELEARTKSQRLDALRWHLIQCAHLAPHTASRDWTREDAVFALSTLCALLDLRKP